jgi:hypothetical protein
MNRVPDLAPSRFGVFVLIAFILATASSASADQYYEMDGVGLNGELTRCFVRQVTSANAQQRYVLYTGYVNCTNTMRYMQINSKLRDAITGGERDDGGTSLCVITQDEYCGVYSLVSGDQYFASTGLYDHTTRVTLSLRNGNDPWTDFPPQCLVPPPSLDTLQCTFDEPVALTP